MRSRRKRKVRSTRRRRSLIPAVPHLRTQTLVPPLKKKTKRRKIAKQMGKVVRSNQLGLNQCLKLIGIWVVMMDKQ